MNVFVAQITNFPKLRREIEEEITSHIQTNTKNYKANVLALIGMERAYLNTNHKDFISKVCVDDQIIRQGMLSIENSIDLNNGELSIDRSIQNMNILFVLSKH